MQTALQIIEIVISVAIILTALLQVKGGGIGGIFGQADTVYRTKRGLEKWLFYGTIVLVVLFVVVAIAMIRLA
ncbi:MAG TPA: preprotein translocase subunit SecG [Dehalococcoidales bacterium]|nr:preprotein translocase subunit SecG [Dehalococcoidales bacterium]